MCMVQMFTGLKQSTSQESSFHFTMYLFWCVWVQHMGILWRHKSSQYIDTDVQNMDRNPVTALLKSETHLSTSTNTNTQIQIQTQIQAQIYKYTNTNMQIHKYKYKYLYKYKHSTVWTVDWTHHTAPLTHQINLKHIMALRFSPLCQFSSLRLHWLWRMMISLSRSR